MREKEYKRMNYLGTNFRKIRVPKNNSDDIPVVLDTSNAYFDLGFLLRGGYQRENVERIKLPCFCSYEWKGRRRLGLLTNTWYKGEGKDESWTVYSLVDMSNQSSAFVGDLIEEGTLEELINEYKINIGKAYITFYEAYY